MHLRRVDALAAPPAPVADIRRFSRFYTRVIGALRKAYLDTPHTIQEARVLYEVGARPGCTATEIRAATSLDQGYLSRLVARLETAGLLRKEASKEDGREQRLHLTAEGKKAFRTLDERADAQAAAMVERLDGRQRAELVAALRTVERLLGGATEESTVTLREGRVGDLGWTFHRQAVVYQEEFGYHDVFETFVCEGLPPFLSRYDAAKDRLWMAEMDGRVVGFIAIHHAHARPGWAKLRWFLVEKEARGRGVGRALLDRALRFSREAGYQGVELTTVSDLVDARRAYERAGFRLAHEEDCPWAPWAREQKWELVLR